MEEKSVLLITYYWPPSGGAGVHRWLRLSQYFKKNGWTLHVYCPDNAEYPIEDQELVSQISKEIIVVKKKIFEPHKYLARKSNIGKGAGLTQQSKSSMAQKMIIWIRGNLFVPDSRIFWIRPSVRFLRSYLEANPTISSIISTGPPHSLHLIARNLKRKKNSLNWIADFRDPWTEIDFYQDLVPGKMADKRQHVLEKSCLTEANEVVTISPFCAEGLEKIAGRKVQVITNGYHFPQVDESKQDLDPTFSIAHFGSMSFARNPEVIWRVLTEICEENPSFRKDLSIKLVGSVDYKIFEQIENYGLKQNLQYIEMVSHKESIALQKSSQILLLVANNTGNVKGILTGKFFEYLGTKRPILAIGEQKSDLEEAIKITESGVFIGYKDAETAKRTLLKWYHLYQEKQLKIQAKNLNLFSSEHLAQKYCTLLDSLQ